MHKKFLILLVIVSSSALTAITPPAKKPRHEAPVIGSIALAELRSQDKALANDERMTAMYSLMSRHVMHDMPVTPGTTLYIGHLARNMLAEDSGARPDQRQFASLMLEGIEVCKPVFNAQRSLHLATLMGIGLRTREEFSYARHFAAQLLKPDSGAQPWQREFALTVVQRRRCLEELAENFNLLRTDS